MLYSYAEFFSLKNSLYSHFTTIITFFLYQNNIEICMKVEKKVVLTRSGNLICWSYFAFFTCLWDVMF